MLAATLNTHSLDACAWIQQQIIIIIKKPLRYPGWSNTSLVHASFGGESLWKTVISCQKKEWCDCDTHNVFKLWSDHKNNVNY